LSKPGAILNAISGQKEATMLVNARILVVILILLLAFIGPATSQDVAASIIENLLKDFHVVQVLDGPANGRVTVRGMIPNEQDLLTVQVDCNLTRPYLIIRNEVKSTQEAYPIERTPCIASFVRLRALSRSQRQ
jgi:hypothetical protein